jgi:AcrR family transcriptional regulator
MTAAGLFLEHGAENVRMTDIAEACGIGVASLYRYFGTKSAIMLEAGTLLWQDVARLFEQQFHSPEYDAASGFGQVKILLGPMCSSIRSSSRFCGFWTNSLDAVILAENRRRTVCGLPPEHNGLLRPVLPRHMKRGGGRQYRVRVWILCSSTAR